MKKNRAFTLIEILVVLVIIGIITMIALLTFGDFGKSRRLESTAKKLAMILPLAQKQAILQPNTIGLKISSSSWQFYALQFNAKKNKSNWLPIKHDRILAKRPIPNDVFITTITNTKNNKNKTINIAFLPTGDITPFKLAIGSKGELAKYQITGEQDGTIKLQTNK